MMYSNKLIMAIKASGKILREHEDNVALPFGSEYSIYLRNKNSVRALVRVEIDGVDVSDGSRFILAAGGILDLERSLRSGNLNEGNKFKFIERTAKIENHRGIGAEDGLVRVEFEFERVFQQLPIVHHPQVYRSITTGYPFPYHHDSMIYGSAISGAAANSLVGSVGTQQMSVKGASAEVASVTRGAAVAKTQSAGITVPGSVSAQQFISGASFLTDGVKHVMILKLHGEMSGEPVLTPVTVKSKSVCNTCGTANKAGSKFCKECGSALQII